MTHEFYKNKLNNIQIQIEHLHAERKQLKYEYTEERRILNQGQKVIYDGLEWEFTGNCEIDDAENVLYQIDYNGIVTYAIFEELEVVNENR